MSYCKDEILVNKMCYFSISSCYNLLDIDIEYLKCTETFENINRITDYFYIKLTLSR